MLERTRRCPYCHRKIDKSSAEAVENPFCQACLCERLERAGAAAGAVQWQVIGDYVHPIPVMEIPSVGAPLLASALVHFSRAPSFLRASCQRTQ